MNPLANRELLIGVSGGIAAYKTAELVSKLVQAGAGVSVVMTRSAHQFIGPATFAALTNRPVATESFEPAAYPLGAHIELARRCELFCVAPATANYLAKAANGLADDLLNTLTLSCTCPILMAPAMNGEMWQKPAVARNVETLKNDGVIFIGPDSGWLSCRDVAEGRMAEPEAIKQAITEHLPAIKS